MSRRFRLKPSTVHERFGDETVIVNLDSGHYYGAQGSASAIWASVVSGASQANILERIATEFTGDRSAIEQATAAFLDYLVEEGLIVPEGANDPGSEPSPAPASDGDAPAVPRVFTPPTLQKYTDMEDMLLLDPIHEVDEQGWPNALKA